MFEHKCVIITAKKLQKRMKHKKGIKHLLQLLNTGRQCKYINSLCMFSQRNLQAIS